MLIVRVERNKRKLDFQQTNKTFQKGGKVTSKEKGQIKEIFVSSHIETVFVLREEDESSSTDIIPSRSQLSARRLPVRAIGEI